MKYSYTDYLDGTCSKDDFINQYNPIKLEVGKVYLQESDSWCKKHYKILFIDDRIALGISVHNSISNKFIGDYDLFYVDNGFKHNDIVRPCYRLVKKVLNNA